MGSWGLCVYMCMCAYISLCVCVRACMSPVCVCVCGRETNATSCTYPRTITYILTPSDPTIHPLHQNTQPPSTHTTTNHDPASAPRSATPAPNPLLGHHITQSHVQLSQGVHAPKTGGNGAAELIVGEGPDATARRASVVVVWCIAMIHACLGC